MSLPQTPAVAQSWASKIRQFAPWVGCQVGILVGDGSKCPRLCGLKLHSFHRFSTSPSVEALLSSDARPQPAAKHVECFCVRYIIQPMQFQPMPLQRRRLPFHGSDWVFELKYDGFRALARIDHGQTQLISRNGNTFSSFQELQQNIGASLPNDSAVLDVEIVCLDHKGRPRFNDLLFRRGQPCFFCFDLLFVNGQDLRLAQLSDRKYELRKLLTRLPVDSRVRYADHIEAFGTKLFEKVCSLDLEGIVAKQMFAPYTFERQISTGYKIRNPHYSQMIGREKLFERERHDEPVAGWHRCALACVRAEAN